MTDTDQF